MPMIPSRSIALDKRTTAEFRKEVREWYRANSRPLPWRTTDDPYAILVSEIMLQQTQVDRVVAKFGEFIARFPDVAALAQAPLQEVLEVWQGLGYNRRAIALKKCAEAIVREHGGLFPRSVEVLETLPGIGPYTSRAVAAFAYNLPTAFIETNIRAVFIHHFFADREEIKDSEILPLVTATLDHENPRDWYNALMDYGVMLKKTHRNPARRSAHHVRQSPFSGSNRELRSRILRTLLATPHLTAEGIAALLNVEATPVLLNLDRMEQEGLIGKNGELYRIG
jgi:A/G-specific adenine glycosylase